MDVPLPARPRLTRPMLFLVFGSTGVREDGGAGRSARAASSRSLACHDFDEMGVPVGRRHSSGGSARTRVGFVQGARAPIARASITCSRVRRRSESCSQRRRPRARWGGVALLDCSDEVQDPLGSPRLGRSRCATYLNWACWMRGHAADPRWQPDVIRDAAGGRDALGALERLGARRPALARTSHRRVVFWRCTPSPSGWSRGSRPSARFALRSA